jgi:hypothetical protein
MTVRDDGYGGFTVGPSSEPLPPRQTTVYEYDRVAPVRHQLLEAAAGLRAMNYPQMASNVEALAEELLDTAREIDRRVGRC